LYRLFVATEGTVRTTSDEFIVRFEKRSHNPILQVPIARLTLVDMIVGQLDGAAIGYRPKARRASRSTSQSHVVRSRRARAFANRIKCFRYT
jgi:hypothetical protein